MVLNFERTIDGSISYRDLATGQLSHNKIGAYTEALQQYVLPSDALRFIQKNGTLRVLDVCYGLGYNSWVLLDVLSRSLEAPAFVQIDAIEIDGEVLKNAFRIFEHGTLQDLKSSLDTLEHNTYYRTQDALSDNHPESTVHNGLEGVFLPVHTIAGTLRGFLSFEIRIFEANVRTIVPNLEDGYDRIFHDAFSPQKMAQLWSVELFRHYHRLLKERDGSFHTYSSAAGVRGGLIEAGFTVQKTRRLGSKSGGISASVLKPDVINDLERLQNLPKPTIENLFNFEAWEDAYLLSRAGIPYRDPNFKYTDEETLALRIQEQSLSDRPSGKPILRARPNQYSK